jgi:hypothetical protein
MIKKYQTGGNVGSSRGVMSALRGLNMKQQSGRQMGDIWQQRVMGETKEDLQEKIEEWQRKMEARQKKSGKLFSKLKFMDFIPGGKWVKAAIKGAVSYGEADKLKRLLGKAGGDFGDFKNTFLGKSAGELSLQYKEAASDIDPLSSLVKSLVSDVVGGKVGEKFSEAFGKTKAPTEFAGENVAELTEMGIDPSIYFEGQGFEDAFTAGTPWKDQARSQFGLGKGEKFTDLFQPGKFTEGTGMDFLGRWGLVPGEEGFLNSPFMRGQSLPDIQEGISGADFSSEPSYTQGRNMFDEYIGSQVKFPKQGTDLQSIFDQYSRRD